MHGSPQLFYHIVPTKSRPDIADFLFLTDILDIYVYKERYIEKYTALWISIIFPGNNAQNQIIDYFILFNAFFDLFKPHFFVFFIKVIRHQPYFTPLIT